ncbi:hypothetical protein ACF0H5_002007 [Mactra antiquata]
MLDSPTQEVPATPVLQRARVQFQSRDSDTPLTNLSADFAVVPEGIETVVDEFSGQNNDSSYNVPGTPLTQESRCRNHGILFSTPRMILKSPAVPKSLEQIVPSTPQGRFLPSGHTPRSGSWSKQDDHIATTPTSRPRLLKAKRTLRTSTLCFEPPGHPTSVDTSPVELGTSSQIKKHVVDATGDNRRSPKNPSLSATDRANLNKTTTAQCHQMTESIGLPNSNSDECEGVKDFLDMI